MAIAPNHWSSMDLKRLLMYLTDLGETQISMFSNFCHVVNVVGLKYSSEPWGCSGFVRASGLRPRRAGEERGSGELWD